jgi:single-strand DNA-binding protein
MDLNQVSLIGNVGQDPKVFDTKQGNKIVRFSIATNERWTDKNGDRQEKTEWHNICVFNSHLAMIAEEYIKKGSRVFVQGRKETGEYESEGVTKQSVDIVIPPYTGQLLLLNSPSSTGENKGKRKASSKSEDPPW